MSDNVIPVARRFFSSRYPVPGVSAAGQAGATILEARALHKTYTTGQAPLHVLRGVNLAVRRGEILAIMGPSGAGKSTLLHLLGGLDEPTQGQTLFEGADLFARSAAERARLRNQRFGFVFQFYHLLPELTAEENVMLPGLIGGAQPRHQLREQAREGLERVGLSARAHHRPSELSGGEMQRVAIARALANRPSVLLCDEPTGNLDSVSGASIAELLWQVRKESGITIVLVTHADALARRADRVARMQDGQLSV